MIRQILLFFPELKLDSPILSFQIDKDIIESNIDVFLTSFKCGKAFFYSIESFFNMIKTSLNHSAKSCKVTSLFFIIQLFFELCSQYTARK